MAYEEAFANINHRIIDRLLAAAPADGLLDRLELIDGPDDNTVTIRAHWIPLARRDG